MSIDIRQQSKNGYRRGDWVMFMYDGEITIGQVLLVEYKTVEYQTDGYFLLHTTSGVIVDNSVMYKRCEVSETTERDSRDFFTLEKQCDNRIN